MLVTPILTLVDIDIDIDTDILALTHIDIRTSDIQPMLTVKKRIHNHIRQILTAKNLNLKWALLNGLHARLIQQLLKANLILNHRMEKHQNQRLRLAQSNVVPARPMWMMIIHLERDT